jgi:hypothetical protein
VVRPVDETVGAINAIYSIVIKPEGKVAQGAYLIIDLPPEVGVNGTLRVTSSLGFPDKLAVSYNKDLHQVKLIDGFITEGSTLDRLTVDLQGFDNPVTMTATGPFGASILNRAGVPLYLL